MKRYTNKILVAVAMVGIVYLRTMGVLTVQELKSQQEYLVYRKFCRIVCWAASYGNVEVGTTSAPLTQKMTADLEGNVEINGISGKVVIDTDAINADMRKGDIRIETPQGTWKVTLADDEELKSYDGIKIILDEVK
jgi:hypothetical protein